MTITRTLTSQPDRLVHAPNRRRGAFLYVALRRCRCGASCLAGVDFCAVDRAGPR